MSCMISVIMPVFNCKLYVEDAVHSILNQTFQDFELIIIDDCSTDGTYEILQEINSKKIQLIKKLFNTGYTNSLNLGISLAKGKYIARMDGDDISHIDRFSKQIQAFRNDLDLVLCGGAYQSVCGNYSFKPSLKYEDVLVDLTISCPFVHPSVMILREVLLENNLNYDQRFEPAEDFDLWTKLCRLGKAINLEDILIYYRIHPEQTSFVKRKSQEENSKVIKENYLKGILNEDFDCNVFIDPSFFSGDKLNQYKEIENRFISAFYLEGLELNKNKLKERFKEFLLLRVINIRYTSQNIYSELKILIFIVPFLGIKFLIKYGIKFISNFNSKSF